MKNKIKNEQEEEELKDQEKESKNKIKNNLLSVVNNKNEFEDKMQDIEFTNQDLGSIISTQQYEESREEMEDYN